tara:strand:+ start:23661 stop:23846 length:186 start_codon:yes stop_codon:yes gene_type:complete
MKIRRAENYSNGEKLQPRKPNSQLSVSLTPKQKAIFVAKAASQGKSLSWWAREVLEKEANK